MGREFQRKLPQRKLPSVRRTLAPVAAGGCQLFDAEICAITGRSPHAVHTATAQVERGQGIAVWTRGRSKELCKWHDEQAAMLRSEAGNLPAAAVAADMHAKTSAALHEARTRSSACDRVPSQA